MVATPIGNLQDISQRSLETLKTCNLIACEDTRVTSKLLTAYNISKPLAIIHEHTQPASVDKLIQRMLSGESVAYVCDAGTPNMNDPGGKLAQAAQDHGIEVTPVPGPSALTAAISVCGFAGFQNRCSCRRAEKDAHYAARAKGGPMIGNSPSSPNVRQRNEPFIILILAVAMSFMAGSRLKPCWWPGRSAV